MAIVKGAINKARQQELFDSVAVVLGIGEYVPPIEIKRLPLCFCFEFFLSFNISSYGST